MLTGVDCSIYSHGSSVWSPLTLSPALWLRSDLGIQIATGVSSWADQSGNGRHATQGTGSQQPGYQANRRSGRPAVTWPATSALQCLNIAWAPGTGDFAIIVIHDITSAELAAYQAIVNRYGLLWASNSPYTYQFYARYPASPRADASTSGGIVISYTYPADAFGLAYLRRSGTAVLARSDEATNTGTSTKVAATSMSLGLPLSLYNAVGGIYEVIGLNAVPSAAQFTQLTAYLNGLYSSSWSVLS